jgi:hypothetical protein
VQYSEVYSFLYPISFGAVIFILCLFKAPKFAKLIGVCLAILSLVALAKFQLITSYLGNQGVKFALLSCFGFVIFAILFSFWRFFKSFASLTFWAAVGVVLVLVLFNKENSQAIDWEYIQKITPSKESLGNTVESLKSQVTLLISEDLRDLNK